MAVDLELAGVRAGRIRRTARGAMQEGGQSWVEVQAAEGWSDPWFVPKVMFDRYVTASREAHDAQEALRVYDYQGRLPEGD